MERFFKGVVATLSFLFIVLFCLSDNINIEKQNRVITEPAIKAAQFEQVPAIIPTVQIVTGKQEQ